MLGVLLGEKGQLGIDSGDAGFTIVRKGGSGGFEILDGLADVAPLDVSQIFRGITPGHSVQDVEEAGVQREGRVEVGDLGEEFAERFALGGVVGDRVQVMEATPAVGEGFGGFLQCQEAAFVGGLGSRLGGNFFDCFLRLGEGVANGWFDGFRGESGPADMEVWG